MGRTIHSTKNNTKKERVTDGKTVEQLNITAVLPIALHTNDADLKHDMKIIHGNESWYVFPTHITEVLNNLDPQYTGQQSQDAVQSEISRLPIRKAFSFVPEKDIPKDAHVLGGRIIMAIKNSKTKNNCSYKVMRTVERNSSSIAKTVRFRNIRLISTL